MALRREGWASIGCDRRSRWEGGLRCSESTRNDRLHWLNWRREREIEMNRGSGIGIIGVILIVLLILWLLGVIKL
jgi:hypothetical protein